MGSGNSPCASCKLLRRRCAKDCIFAPYFPSDDPHKFAIVHKVFGASNVSKMLQELPVHQRADAVSSLVYEANARLRDPVYGCVGAISFLQNQVSELQMQLAVAQAEILCIQMHQDPSRPPPPPPPLPPLPPPLPSQIELLPADFEYEKPCFIGHNNNNNSLNFSAQYNNFAPSAPTSINHVIHDSLKRESIFGNDMVS